VLVGLVLSRGLMDHKPRSTAGQATFSQGSTLPPEANVPPWPGPNVLPLVAAGGPGSAPRKLDDMARSMGLEIVSADGAWEGKPYVRLRDTASGDVRVFRIVDPGDAATLKKMVLNAAQTVTRYPDGRVETRVASRPATVRQELHPVGHVSRLPGGAQETGPLGPLEYIEAFSGSTIITWRSDLIVEPDGTSTTIYYPVEAQGSDLLRPGNHPSLAQLRTGTLTHQLNFLSLMLALFCGTASLPHILIRYYTVPSQAAARKSTIVGITSIGFFYVLTLYMGLGAMTSGAMDVTDSNMAAPLLARSFSQWLFAVISAIAFTTVLGTVSGLIIAASGAVVHDLMSSFLKIEMHDSNKVRVARIASVCVGGIAILLGIAFERMNVNYLVGWAFSIAASANLPSLVMLLFWKGTTKQGITAAVLVGMLSSLAWILLSGDTYKDVYGLPAQDAIVPFSQPGIVTIPLGFLTLVVVSLLTRSQRHDPGRRGP
ncbi:MAG TPA: hypothetical protein VML55_06885, partial [Planctomycetaceae bacterium]|nr:hypothetical protein [Planctomycetaceae bacterium]